MKKTCWVAALTLLLFPFLVFSQTHTKPRIGILEFTAIDVSQGEANAVSELVTTEIVRTARFDVVDRKNIESLLREMQFQLSGCTDSTCAVEIGQILGLEFMIYGSVLKLGRLYSINMQMINVATAQIVHTGREQFRSIEDAYKTVPKLVGTFVGTFSSGKPTEPAVDTQVKKALTQRNKTGRVLFFGGLTVFCGSSVLWYLALEDAAYSMTYYYERYMDSDIQGLPERKEEYLASVKEYNLYTFSAAAASAIGAEIGRASCRERVSLVV